LRLAASLGRQLFDRTLPALGFAVPILLVLCGTAATWWAVDTGRWGASVRTAWRNEAIAERNALLLRQEIARVDFIEPERVKLLKTALTQQRELVPSPFSPWATRQSFPPSQRGWEVFYHLHHFLFRSFYPRVIGFYLLLGVAFGWRGSKRWWRRRWLRGTAQNTPERLFLGLDDEGVSYLLSQEERNKHLLVAGTTGSGKTEALKLLARHDIENGRGLVFLDMKGDRSLAEALFSACVAAGRKEDFLYFTLERGACHRYNALATGDALAKRDRLIGACTWSPELFYRNEAKAATGRVLNALAPEGAVTFDDLYLAFDDLEAYAEVARRASPVDQPKFERDLQDWKTFSRNLSGLRANLHEFIQMREQLCTAHGDIDFREVHARNRVVYFELNSQMRKEVAASVAKLVLEDLKHLSGALAAGAARDRKPFSIYIDEARNALYEGFVGLVSQCRSAGIGLVIASQSPLDFDDGEEERGVTLAITQNTATKLIFCQRDPESAQFCAELGGTKDTLKRTTQMADDGFFGPMPTGVHSEREVKEFAVHPDTLKSLGVGRAYLLKGDGTRTVIQVHHRPIPPAPFAPSIPRTWHHGDREKLGHAQPPLDLGRLLAARRPVYAPARRRR
jgi:hypothetical protein